MEDRGYPRKGDDVVMATPWYLMRKNEIVTLVSMEENGNMHRFAADIREEIAPLQHRYDPEWLKKWWSSRAVPVSRDGVREMLRDQGMSLPSEYLIKNLGLSLTDYYWIKPVDSQLTWEQVNLFDHDFKSTLSFQSQRKDGTGTPLYSPNSSLQGDIEKTWAVIYVIWLVVNWYLKYLW